jgi:hypothetical protein
VSAGLLAASRSEARLIVCDVASVTRIGIGLRHAEIPCPLVLRHDLSREAIDALCDVARLDADIRPSFRDYDDLAHHLGDRGHDERNATREILRGIAPADGSRVRDFITVMAVLGERPVMQSIVARSLAMSSSSFRAWLARLRQAAPALPAFPRLNAHFVALHLVWRRERMGWTGKRSAATAGFADDKACANYLRYHLGATGGQLLRAGGFDARMTAARHIFAADRLGGAGWRI